jgi:hypothetical protein
LYERLEKREGIEKILINDIKKLETRLEMLDRAEENSSISFNNKLISLNVVYIYD